MRFLKRLVPVLASTMVAGLFATTTLAQGQFGTAAEAKVMLEKAVAEENYETAATLRDQIKQLEHEMAS